jgi:WD40 repeat protein
MKLLAGNDWLSFSQESDQPVLAISFSPSGRSLLAVFPNMIVSWDVDSRRRQSARLLSTKAAHFSPRGNLLISFASVEGRIWNISEHGQIDAGWSLTQEVSLGPVSLSQFGTSVAGRVSSKAEAGIWDIVSGTRTTTVRSRMHWGFEKVVIHPNGRALLTGYRDGVLEGWEIPTGKSLGKLNGHKVPVVAIAYSADGKVVVSGGRSQSGRGSEVIVWDGQRDKEKRRIRANKSISDLVLSSGGTWLALLETDGIATIMKTDGHANEILPFEKETNWFNEVNCLAFSPDSRFVVGGNGPPSSFVASGFLYVWDVQNARFVARHQKLNNSNVCAVAFVGDNELVFGGIQAYLNGFDLGTGGTTLRYFKSTDIFSVTLAIAMSPDRKMFAVGTGSVRAIPKSLDGPLSEIKLFEVGNVNPVGFFKDENLGVHALAISQDGNLLASGGQDGSLVVWDIAARKKRQSLLGNDQTVSCVAFSKDGRYLACGRHDHNVRVWNLSTGDQVGLFRGHGGYVTSIVFDPSGESIVSASADRTVRIWDFVTGQARASWAVAESAKSSPRYDTGFVRKGAFDTVPMALSPDGNTLVVGVSGEGIRMWRASPR